MIHINKNNLKSQGHFEYSTRKINADWTPWSVDENLVVAQGRDYQLGAAYAQSPQKTAFYIAPFSGNVTPQDSWTGANFTANATEFTNYVEATRVLWNKDAVAAGAISNTTNPATFTVGVGGGTIRGFALLESSAKSATTGILSAATRLATDKVLEEGEEIRVRYVLTLNNDV